MCQTTNVSAHGPFRVDLCSCGSVHVHLGPAMVRLTPDSLPHLTETLRVASERLPIVQRSLGSEPRAGDRN